MALTPFRVACQGTSGTPHPHGLETGFASDLLTAARIDDLHTVVLTALTVAKFFAATVLPRLAGERHATTAVDLDPMALADEGF